jgi:hypothetical protein
MVYLSETGVEGDVSFSASTWRFEGNIARVPDDADRDNPGSVKLEPIDPDWEVTKWETSPMVSIAKPIWG